MFSLRFLLFWLFLGLVWASSVPVMAQEPQEDIFDLSGEAPIPTGPDEFYRARVTGVVSEKYEEVDIAGVEPYSQVLRIELLDGDKRGEVLDLNYGSLQEAQKLAVDDVVVVIKPGSGVSDKLYIFDRYRMPSLVIIFSVVAVAVVLLAGWRGVGSLFGVGISVAVMLLYAVPQIMAGQNPFMVSFVAAVGVTLVSIYLAHGFTRRTHVALAGTLTTVLLSLGVAWFFVWLTRLGGLGSEEAYYLQLAPTAQINLKGLLLGAIVIGALGVLDDITTAQAAAVDEISSANPKLSVGELLRRGMSVGKEHITSLVNTLVLAYIGASFPALLLFTLYERPWWVVMNSEVIAEEIVRTLVGSLALMLAVPITTALAAYFLRRGNK